MNKETAYAGFLRRTFVYISTIFAAGFAFGVAFGFIFRWYSEDRSSQLKSEVQTIRQELEQLRKELNADSSTRKRVIPVTFDAYFDDDDEGADEFFEAVSTVSSKDSGDFFSPAGSPSPSSSSSFLGIRSSASPSGVPLPPKVAEELDQLAATALSGTDEPDLASQLFSRCLAYKKQYKRYPDFLWRFARAAYLVWNDLERNHAQSTATFASPMLQTASQFVDVGLSISRRAVQLAEEGLAADGVSTEDAALAYKWLAIFVGLTANSSGVNQRIQLGYDFKKYIDASIELNPDDAYCHLLKGRWCFEVYNLTWFERQFASRLFATPPSATIEDAVAEFLEVCLHWRNHSPK
uniref:Regulator of microtubule dynamics protein 1 n=1 Tax=Mesocestoides corti TaxID=53468 RepID=A0A5K3EU70_MESCO